jgi:thiol-disulfide isomerase/thioredoxin
LGDKLLKNGIWRGELTVQNKQAPFLFEIKFSGTDSASLTLINGAERVLFTDIKYVSDTLVVPIEAYDAVIKAKVTDGNRLEGHFVRNYIENDAGIPFKAESGNSVRFEPVAKPVTISIDGKWDIFFTGANDTVHNVGIFSSENQIVTGSILTNSGDLRFLEGAVTEKGVRLSAFSGLSPYLIEFSFIDDNSFEGQFYTARSLTKLSGKRNNHASLEDPYNMAYMKNGLEQLNFQLPDMEGNIVSLNDDIYKGKVVIVSILGSWCPNCLDETGFLSPWYKANKERGIEILGLAFERKDDFNYAKTAINRLRKKYSIDYEILFAGQVGAGTIAKVLPEIENFSSYPTTIFIDKKGKVRKIHTGYSGPATGLFYEEFKKDFNDLVNDLVNEE